MHKSISLTHPLYALSGISQTRVHAMAMWCKRELDEADWDYHGLSHSLVFRNQAVLAQFLLTWD